MRTPKRDIAAIIVLLALIGILVALCCLPSCTSTGKPNIELGLDHLSEQDWQDVQTLGEPVSEMVAHRLIEAETVTADQVRAAADVLDWLAGQSLGVYTMTELADQSLGHLDEAEMLVLMWAVDRIFARHAGGSVMIEHTFLLGGEREKVLLAIIARGLRKGALAEVEAASGG